MTFLFKMHRAEGIDPLAYRVAQEKARKAWKSAPRVYPGTFHDHLKSGDFDHIIPPNYYYLEDFSHLEHKLPPDHWKEWVKRRANPSELN